MVSHFHDTPLYMKHGIIFSIIFPEIHTTPFINTAL